VASALALELVGQLLHEPRAPERIGHVDGARLVRDHLLRCVTRCAPGFARERERFVEGIGVQALGTAENRGERLPTRLGRC